MTAVQTELFSLTAEDFGVETIDTPQSDWAIDCRPPVQDRSVQDWRSVFVDRARESKPRSIESDRCGTSRNLGTIDLGTMPQQSPNAGKDELGTSSQLPTSNSPQKSPKVPKKRTPKYALPGMYREWLKVNWYWRIKIYVDGERKTFHLHENYDKAVAIGRKILANLENKAA